MRMDNVAGVEGVCQAIIVIRFGCVSNVDEPFH